jgi:hypothetical protein
VSTGASSPKNNYHLSVDAHLCDRDVGFGVNIILHLSAVSNLSSAKISKALSSESVYFVK